MRIDGSLSTLIPNPLPAAAPHAAAPASPAARHAALTDVLTPEEREYFARMEQMGPLTYGRRPSVAPPAPDAPRGQRIDFRA